MIGSNYTNQQPSTLDKLNIHLRSLEQISVKLGLQNLSVPTNKGHISLLEYRRPDYNPKVDYQIKENSLCSNSSTPKQKRKRPQSESLNEKNSETSKKSRFNSPKAATLAKAIYDATLKDFQSPKSKSFPSNNKVNVSSPAPARVPLNNQAKVQKVNSPHNGVKVMPGISIQCLNSQRIPKHAIGKETPLIVVNKEKRYISLLLEEQEVNADEEVLICVATDVRRAVQSFEQTTSRTDNVQTSTTLCNNSSNTSGHSKQDQNAAFSYHNEQLRIISQHRQQQKTSSPSVSNKYSNNSMNSFQGQNIPYPYQNRQLGLISEQYTQSQNAYSYHNEQIALLSQQQRTTTSSRNKWHNFYPGFQRTLAVPSQGHQTGVDFYQNRIAFSQSNLHQIPQPKLHNQTNMSNQMIPQQVTTKPIHGMSANPQDNFKMNISNPSDMMYDSRSNQQISFQNRSLKASVARNRPSARSKNFAVLKRLKSIQQEAEICLQTKDAPIAGCSDENEATNMKNIAVFNSSESFETKFTDAIQVPEAIVQAPTESLQTPPSQEEYSSDKQEVQMVLNRIMISVAMLNKAKRSSSLNFVPETLECPTWATSDVSKDNALPSKTQSPAKSSADSFSIAKPTLESFPGSSNKENTELPSNSGESVDEVNNPNENLNEEFESVSVIEIDDVSENDSENGQVKSMLLPEEEPKSNISENDAIDLTQIDEEEEEAVTPPSMQEQPFWNGREEAIFDKHFDKFSGSMQSQEFMQRVAHVAKVTKRTSQDVQNHFKDRKLKAATHLCNKSGIKGWPQPSFLETI